MEVLKIELEGLTTSFRYPHFLVGKQPSYPMPPPATIYGHICSAVGDHIDPSYVKFAYYFSYEEKGDDVEAIYQASFSTGKIDKKWGEVKNIEAVMNPFLREIFLFPRLTLYLTSSDDLTYLYDAFSSPVYPVILGRSQDLASYRSVKMITLEKSPFAYFEGTLLPGDFAMRTGSGISLLMPQFINQEDRRNVKWGKYVALEKRVFFSGEEEKELMLKLAEGEEFWIDPDTIEIKGLHRAVIWHSFTEEECVI